MVKVIKLSKGEIRSIKTIIKTVSIFCVRLGENAMPSDLEKKAFTELEKRKWFNLSSVILMQAVKDYVVFRSYKNHFPEISISDLFLINEQDVVFIEKLTRL